MTDFHTGLGKNPANHQPLTPIDFIIRSAQVYPDKTAIIYDDLEHNNLTQSWQQTYDRCRQLADGLRKLGIDKNDTVAVMMPNTPAMVECAFGVPMSGGVLCTLNTRLDINALTFCLQHSEAKVLILDSEFAEHAEIIDEAFPNLTVIHATDAAVDTERFGQMTYDELIASSDSLDNWEKPLDEWDAIALNYTSGTTGKPKGVVYHHRGATLNAISNILDWDMPKHTMYLWTLPLFHCNGWCFPWTIAERAGVNVCLRQINADLILQLIAKYKVSHYCSAPVVHNMIASGKPEYKDAITHEVNGWVAGAPPSETMLAAMEEMGFHISHVYGLTEVYGPVTVCAEQEEWNALDVAERSQKKSRQGVTSHLMTGFDVFKQGTTEPVAADGEEMGELALRGNMVMKGYLKSRKATEAAFADGWFRTGDLGVKYPDGYIKIMDRLKDIIISGGENISSIEVENVLYKMPEIQSCAVVAAPHDKWGEVPVAFIEIYAGSTLQRDHVMEHCTQYLAGFKVPKYIVFAEIPKTSTGKVQKFELRQAAKSLAHETPKVTFSTK
ncbi:AMP-binding protein [Psychrobacter sp. AOP22-C1-22]|uniref:AMP-binding protein n=1 Tax=unclassified Psychrobacter TaxID=196806 RepID=UPI0017886F3F|nr:MULTISPECIES: AMP-binding protein [unclassified Psychrobacter]MBE0406786.1 AMP-binding protein [Psychrobacter sp. FME6]MBE0445292.1 AMP-binding protein [Psychrobacter sp. FME5]MDN5801302.1 AMP-binding protein [Psychrobacter sp.]